MANRISDAGKWDDPWFRALAPPYKLAWLYLLDAADLAGVVELDRDLANFRIRDEVDWDEFFQLAGTRIDRLSGSKLWIPKAVWFQLRKKFNPSCNYDRGVRRCLQQHGLWDVFTQKYPSSLVKKDERRSTAFDGVPTASNASEGEGEGEGEGIVFGVSALNGGSSTRDSRVTTTPPDERDLPRLFESDGITAPDCTRSGDSNSNQGKGKSRKLPLAKQPQSEFSLTLRSGDRCFIPQPLVDRIRRVYGDDIDFGKEIGKAEIWLGNEGASRHPVNLKGLCQFVSRWFAMADKMQQRELRQAAAANLPATPAKFEGSRLRIPPSLRPIRDDITRWAYHLRDAKLMPLASVQAQVDAMQPHGCQLVRKAIDIGIQRNRKSLVWDEARQAMQEDTPHYERLN